MPDFPDNPELLYERGVLLRLEPLLVERVEQRAHLRGGCRQIHLAGLAAELQELHRAGKLIVRLPQLPLPRDWGVRIGGPLTAEGLISAIEDGLRLATMLVCVGAANALASPARLLNALPGA